MTRQELVRESLKYVEDHLDGALSVQDMALQAGYSPSRFSRIFREAMGMAPMEYVKKRKLIHASQEILKGKKIIDAAIDMGYASPLRIYQGILSGIRFFTCMSEGKNTLGRRQRN